MVGDTEEPAAPSLAQRVDAAFGDDDDTHEQLQALEVPIIGRAFSEHLSDLLDGRTDLP